MWDRTNDYAHRSARRRPHTPSTTRTTRRPRYAGPESKICGTRPSDGGDDIGQSPSRSSHRAPRTATSFRGVRSGGCAARLVPVAAEATAGCLDLRLLVHAQYQRSIGRAHVQPHDVWNLVDEQWGLGQFERSLRWGHLQTVCCVMPSSRATSRLVSPRAHRRTIRARSATLARSSAFAPSPRAARAPWEKMTKWVFGRPRLHTEFSLRTARRVKVELLSTHFGTGAARSE
jgi:hypothetical protein